MLFLLGDTIIDYFQHVSKPTNELHRAFVNGWNTSKSNIVHLRCLAVIGCVITWPWLALAGKDLNILDMNRYFHTAREVMQSWHENPLGIMTEWTQCVRRGGNWPWGLEVALSERDQRGHGSHTEGRLGGIVGCSGPATVITVVWR